MSKQVMRKHMEERLLKVTNYSLYPDLPASLNVELNNTCNHKCVYCAYHGDNSKKNVNPYVMDIDFAKKIIKEAHRLGMGKKELGLYIAGEPFLYKHLAEVIRYAKSLDFPYVFLTTNGSMATPEKIKEVLDAGLDSIRFSLNAADRQSYIDIHGRDDFDTVLENIRFFHEYKEKNHIEIATSATCVVTKKTKGIEEKIHELLDPYVDDVVFFTVILDRMRDEKFIKEYELVDYDSLDIDPNFICPTVFDSMYIGSNKKIMPCCSGYTYDTYVGDLEKEFDFEKIWHGEAFVRYRKIFLEGLSDKGTLCDNCFMRKNTNDIFF